MANVIKLKTGTSTPTTSNLVDKEVAIDTSAQKFYVNDSGTVKEIGGISDVVADTTPQLGGALDVQAQEINTSTSNGNIKLAPNGTGLLEVKGNTNAGTIQLNCENNSHGVKIKGPPHSASASYTLTLPNDDGSADQVLKTDGSGVLSWVDQSGGGGGSGDKISEGNTEVETVDTGSDGHIKFTTEGTENLRITNEGNLLLGTTTNSGEGITVYGDAGGTIGGSKGSAILFQNSNTGTGNTSGLYVGNFGDKHGYIWNYESSSKIVWGTSNQSRMTLDPLGRLLLGTTAQGESAADDLTIANANAGDTGITIRSGSTNTGNIYFSDATSGTGEYDGYIQYDQDDRHLILGTASTERFRITSTGAWSIEGASNYGTSGQVLTSNGDDAPTWQNASGGGGGSSTLAGLTDVTISSASNGQVLKYNGSAWVNDTDATGSGGGGGGISTGKAIAMAMVFG